MFFPYGTDAPIYHWPITTAALIAVNAGSWVLGVGFSESKT